MSFPMKFKEKVYDEEGNVKYDKNGNILYQFVMRIVHHNPGYFPKRK